MCRRASCESAMKTACMSCIEGAESPTPCLLPCRLIISNRQKYCRWAGHQSLQQPRHRAALVWLLAPEPCGGSETPLALGRCGLSSFRGRRVGESDGIGASPARLGRHFRLFARVEVGLCCVSGLDDDRHGVAYRRTSGCTEPIAKLNEKATPTVPDIAVEPCSICRALHEPAVATPSKPKGLLEPNRLGVEWDDYNGYSLVALNQPRFKTCFAHASWLQGTTRASELAGRVIWPHSSWWGRQLGSDSGCQTAPFRGPRARSRPSPSHSDASWRAGSDTHLR